MFKHSTHDFFGTVLFVALVVFINFIVKAGNENARFCCPTAVFQADQVLWVVKVYQLVNSYRCSEGCSAFSFGVRQLKMSGLFLVCLMPKRKIL